MGSRVLPDDLDIGAWAALQGAFDAWQAGGLPCGASIVDAQGAVIARGRNHAYDTAMGSDVLEGSPIAHAELNALAHIPTSRDLSRDTLWSTQQPCSMCSGAIEFCGVGKVRYLAIDPAFIATSDPRAGTITDPTHDYPELTAWAVLANALFLQPAIARADSSRLARNESSEPETVAAAGLVSAASEATDLRSLIEILGDDLVSLADRRRARLGY